MKNTIATFKPFLGVSRFQPKSLTMIGVIGFHRTEDELDEVIHKLFVETIGHDRIAVEEAFSSKKSMGIETLLNDEGRYSFDVVGGEFKNYIYEDWETVPRSFLDDLNIRDIQMSAAWVISTSPKFLGILPLTVFGDLLMGGSEFKLGNDDTMYRFYKKQKAVRYEYGLYYDSTASTSTWSWSPSEWDIDAFRSIYYGTNV